MLRGLLSFALTFENSQDNAFVLHAACMTPRALVKTEPDQWILVHQSINIILKC